MLLSAFLDLGFPRFKLQEILRALGISRVRIQRERVQREGQWAIRTRVVELKPSRRVPSSAHDWVTWAANSGLRQQTKEDLVRILRTLAKAEGKIHREAPAKVRFHQLARVETMVELAGLCAAVSFFRIGGLHVSAIPMGRSYQDPHGRWRFSAGPVASRLLKSRFQNPVGWREDRGTRPGQGGAATAYPGGRYAKERQRRHGPAIGLRSSQTKGFEAGSKSFRLKFLPYRFEWTTPTAAAFLAARAVPAPAPPFQVLRIGRSVGHRRAPVGPSVLRLLLGEPL